MAPVSLGDLAQSLLLRHATGGARATLNTLTATLAAGQAVDPGRHLEGQVRTLQAIDATLMRNMAFERSLGNAAARSAAMQSALVHVDRLASDLARSLFTVSQSTDPDGALTAGKQAAIALGAIVDALNADYGGRALFAGVATDKAALASANEIMDAARHATADASSPAEAAAALNLWLDDAGGFAVSAYRGTDQGISVSVGPDEAVVLGATAMDPALRKTLSGAILGAFLAEGRFGSAQASQSALSRIAADTIVGASAGRTAMMAQLGVAEARINDAATQLKAESSSLNLAKSDLLFIDLYETSSRLSETENRLQSLYAITARLSRLSLTDYL